MKKLAFRSIIPAQAGIFLAFLLAACGEQGSTENITQINQMGMDVVASVDELPECTKENEGEMAFVRGETSARVCVDEKWFATKESISDTVVVSKIDTLFIEDGDFSCETKPLADSSGVKIICNGDSIGVVLNGKDGAQGEPGAAGKDGTGKDGSDGKDGAGCSLSQSGTKITITCGDKSTTLDLNIAGNLADTTVVDSEKVETPLDSLTGYSQKGPFLKGSTVYLYELSDGRTLKQTNGNFMSNIIRDDGRYKFTARNLVSQYALIVVDGHYRNEVTGENSKNAIKLKALTDVTARNSVNVNLLTHLEYERAYYLVTVRKMRVAAAKRQAQAEILKAFHIDTTGLRGFNTAEDLNVIGSTDADAALLAISILLQGDRTEANMMALLAEISLDMAEDGKWNDSTTKTDSVRAAIAEWAMVMDLDDRLDTIAENVRNWGLGNAPDFAKHVRNYWLKEYGIEDCASATEGKTIMTRDGKSRYYCSANGWNKVVVGWSWDYPKEIFFNPEIEYDTVIDPRDKKVYKIVTIGNQTWMAENLNYADSSKTLSLKGSSWCYNNVAKNCDVGGRLYTWAAAIDSVKIATDTDNPQECGYGKTCTLPAKVLGICPTGWHLPSVSEWDSLFSAVGGETTASKILKSQVGWNINEMNHRAGNGTDAFGFAALPAGNRINDGNFAREGIGAYFWSSTENSGAVAYHIDLFYSNEDVTQDSRRKDLAYSVRCIKD